MGDGTDEDVSRCEKCAEFTVSQGTNLGHAVDLFGTPGYIWTSEVEWQLAISKCVASGGDILEGPVADIRQSRRGEEVEGRAKCVLPCSLGGQGQKKTYAGHHRSAKEPQQSRIELTSFPEDRVYDPVANGL